MIYSYVNKRVFAGLLAAGSFLLAGTQAATSQADTLPAAQQVACGETGLTLDAKTAKLFKKAKISVAAVAEAASAGSSSAPNPCPAKLAGKNQLLFPVTTGSSTQPTLLGSNIEHRNGLRIKLGRKSVLLNTFTIQIDASGKAVLAAKVNKGKQLTKLIDLNLKSATSERKGAVTNVSMIKATLNSTAAKALNKALGIKALKKGVALGTFNTSVAFNAVAIKSGSTTVTLDSTTGAALKTLGISLAPLDPATADASGSLVFPVTGGELGASLAPAKITHSGGIAFVKGATRLELKNFEINVAADKTTISAETGTSRQDILAVTLPSTLPNLADVTPGTNPVAVNGATLKLTAGAALVLNQVFGTTGFTEGLTLGTANLQLNLQ